MARPAAAQRLCCSSQLSLVGSPVYSTARTVAVLYPLRMIMVPNDHWPGQNSPMKFPSQAQEPAEQEPEPRASSMAVWLPWPEQPHSVSHNSPMKLLEQTQALPLINWPNSPQLSSQYSPRWLPVQTHSPNSPSHAASFSHAPQPLK